MAASQDDPPDLIGIQFSNQCFKKCVREKGARSLILPFWLLAWQSVLHIYHPFWLKPQFQSHAVFPVVHQRASPSAPPIPTRLLVFAPRPLYHTEREKRCFRNRMVYNDWEF